MNTDMIVNNGKFDMTWRDGTYYSYYLFGLQRTGTTIIERVIRDNWKMAKRNDLINIKQSGVTPPSPEVLTWKHCIWVPDKFEQGYPTVLVYKNPYLWVESMVYRKGCAQGNWQKTYGDLYFENHFWRTDEHDNGSVYIDQLLRVYKVWFDNWIPYYKNNKDTTVLIKFEDLLPHDNRIPIFNECAEKFGWDRFELSDLNWANHVGSSAPFTQAKKEYYPNGVPEQIGPNIINLVNQIIGRDLIEELGYKVL